MLLGGGREAEEEVTGGKINYDLMLENILKGGYHGVCINLRAQVLICQSLHCSLNATTVGDLTLVRIHISFHAGYSTEMQICAHMHILKHM